MRTNIKHPFKKALNPIPPTLRKKKRYILFKLLCDKKLSENDVNFAINEVMLSLFGSFGSAEINSKLIEWRLQENTGILECERSSVKKAVTALQFLKEIKGMQVLPNIISVSGTLKSLRELQAR